MSNIIRNKLTKDKFNMFNRRFGMFSDMFGLVNWEIHIIRQKDFTTENELNLDEITDWRALTTCSIDDKLAYVVVAEEWDVPFDNYWISKIAFHEALEVLLWPLFNNLPTESRSKNIHDIIRTLENSFYDLMFEKIIKNKK